MTPADPQAGVAEKPAPPELLPIEDALALVLAHVSPLPVEQVPLEHVHGRFLAADVNAAIDLPPFAELSDGRLRCARF